MISLLWYIVAAVHMVSLVEDIMNGAPSLEHETLMLLALLYAKFYENDWMGGSRD